MRPVPDPGLWQALARLIHRRPFTILGIAVALAVVAVLGASRLRVDAELRRLLPDHFPSVSRLDEASARLGHQDDLFVTIRSPSRDANIAFGNAIAQGLQARPDIRYVLFHHDFSFFEEHALLYASLEDLLELRRRIIERIRDEVRKAAFGDFALLSEQERERKAKDPEASLGLSKDEVRERYGLDSKQREYLEAEDGALMVVKARPTRPSTDIAFSRELGAAVRSLVETTDPAKFHPEMTVEINGAYAQHTGRVRTLQDDVVGGSLAALSALLLTIALYFRSARAIVLVMLPLLVATTGALAFAWAAFEALNLVSAFIFAVLLGLGIDFGIHVLSRYRHERGRGQAPALAFATTFATTGKTTAAGAVSTALAFAVLVVADFQGFAQFGVVAGFGVMLALVGSLVVMPALTLALDRLRAWKAHPPVAPERRPGADPRPPGRPRVLSYVLVGAGIAFAAWSVAQLDEIEFEYDLDALGPVKPPREGPQPKTYRDAVGKTQTLAPAMVLAESPAQVEAVQRQLEALLAMTPEQVAAFDPLHPPVSEQKASADRSSEADAKAGGDAAGDDRGDELDAFAEDGDELDELDAFSEDGDELDDFEDEDLEDPRFVELERKARAESLVDPATAVQLGQYGLERLQVMDDRLRGVFSIFAFVPRHQPEKLAVIADIRARIDAKRDALSDETRAQVDEWSRYLKVDRPIGPEDLPSWITDQFRDDTGRIGNFAVVWTGGSKADYRNSRRIYDGFGRMITSDGEVPVAADFFVIPEIFEAIRNDGPVVLALSAAVMVLTAVVLLRTVTGVIMVVCTLLMSLAWLGGAMVLLGWKLNFFNVIILPLLIGMGQDASLHIYERAREEAHQRMTVVLRETGGAVFISTLTTIWGFSGILFANHRGLHSMAWMAVLGLTLTFLGSVVVLPAMLDVFRRRTRS